jgi:2-keto-4-pentenoate hydratase
MAKAWEDARIARGMKEQLGQRRALIEAGGKPLGWKVGFGAPAMMEKLGITAPLLGFLMQSGRIATGGSASLAGWAKPIAEPEIAVHIGADVAGGGDRAAAAAAIAGLGQAIELVDAHLPFEDPEAILAANVFQRHVVLGPPDTARAGGDTAGLTARLMRRGAEAGRTSEPEALTGKVADIVRHVADVLAAFGERLARGDIIIAGSVLPPALIEPDETGITYALDPVGSISVAFTR